MNNMIRQEAMSETLILLSNTLKQQRELRELDALKKAVEAFKRRPPDAVVETFCSGTGKELLTETSLITIYKNPADYPDKFVARIWEIDIPTQYIALADTIEGICAKIPENRIDYGRAENDDPIIVGVVAVPIPAAELIIK